MDMGILFMLFRQSGKTAEKQLRTGPAAAVFTANDCY